MTNKNYNYRQIRFVTSTTDICYLLNDNGIEIAFVGYSNTGKSSALNALAEQKKLAYTSKVPGRTQLINLFEVKNGIRLVDFPGYGYAKNLKSVKQQWQITLSKYLRKRKSLKGLIMLTDIRHPLKNIDMKIINLSIAVNIPILLLLTKADKLAPNKQKEQLINVNSRLKITVTTNLQVEIFSSSKMIGINKLRLKLNEWVGKKSSKDK